MDFLRALSRHAERTTARASAILPSRFAGTGPLHHVPVTPVGAEPVEAESRPNAADAPARPAMAATGRFEPNPVENDDRIATRHHRDDANQRAAAGPKPLGDVALRVERPAASDGRRETPVPRLREAPLSSPRRPETRGRHVERDATPGQSRTAAPASQTHRARTDLPRVTAQAPSAAPAPLSPAAVATRGAQREHHRPVIHVTIDRIDVRAAASSPAALPVKPRAAAPRTSLSEYLRAGANRSGGER
jgi:hypothetical protein